jgi:hypothetical protein
MRLKPRSLYHLNRAFHSLLLSLALLSLVLLYRSTDPDPYDRYVALWFPVGVFFLAAAELLAERSPVWGRRCRLLAGGCAMLFVASLLAVFLALR